MSDEASRSAGAVAVAGFLALAAALGIGRFVYTPILPFMVEAIGLSKSEAGLIASANFLGYLVGALGAASSFSLRARKVWLLAGLALSAFSTAAMGATTSVMAYLVLRFLGGLASAYVLVFSSTLILNRIAAAGRPGLSGLHFAGVGSGIALSAIVVAGLAAYGHDWRMLWVVSGLIALAAVAAVAWLIPDESREAAVARAAGRIAIAPKLAALILAYGLFGFGYVITATFISTLVRTSPDIRWLEPAIWAVVGLAAAPSVAFWTPMGRRLGNARALAVACLLEAGGVALTVLWTTAAGVVIGAILLGGTLMGITALGLVHARALSGGDPQRVLALITAAFGLGQIVGPTFAGILVDVSGGFTAPTLAAAAALLAAAFFGLKAETKNVPPRLG